MKKARRTNINENDLSLGEFIRQLRKDSGTLQKDVARQLGVKAVTYSAYENDRIKPPADKLYILAKYYDVNVELLMNKLNDEESVRQEDSDVPTIKNIKEETAMLEELAYYFRNLDKVHKKAVYDLAKTLYIN